MSNTKRSGHVKKYLIAVLVLVVLSMIAVPVSVAASAANKLTVIGCGVNFGPEMQQAFDLFTARTGVSIDLVPVTSWEDVTQKVITMSAAGVPLDVVYGDDLRIFAFAEQKLLQPIDTLIARDGMNMRVYPAPVVEGMKVRGNLYSLPTAVSINGLFYNADLFDKFGQRHLPTDWSSQEFNWDEFIAIAKKMTIDTNGDGKTDQYGLHGFGSYGGFNQIGLWNAQDTDFNRTRYNGSDPQVLKALGQIMSIYTEHKVHGGNFLNGTAAMLTVQSYYVNNIRTQMDKGSFFSWKIGVLPRAETRVSQSAFLSLGITAGSKNTENAWKFIRFLTYDTEGALLFTRAENRTPVLRETMRDYLQRWAQLMPNSNLQVFTDATSVVWRWNLMSGYGSTEIGNMLNKTWSRIRSGASIQTAMLEITPQIQAILDDGQRN